MNHLLRDVAPISEAGWAEIENEAKRSLKSTLAARRLVDFAGPKGWAEAAVVTGHNEKVAPPPGPGIEARQRRVLPLVELRVPFELPREALAAIDRGARDADLDPVIHAARTIALAEDRAVFHGYAAAGIRGIAETQAATAVPLTEKFEDYPAAVATALAKLHDAGVDGPFAIALGERCYKGLSDTTRGGYPVMEHVQRMIAGPLVWAPGVDGAVVLSQRGGDFQLTVGEDFSIGYLEHDAERVRLYIEESFTFWLLSPQAAIPLKYASPGAAAGSSTRRSRR